MILAVDVGNSNIVLGCIENGEIENIIRLHTEPKETSAEYTIKLMQMMSYYRIDPGKLEGAIISSAVPPVTEVLIETLTGITGKRPMVVGPGIKTGMNVRIDDPSTLAGDLVVGNVAAMAYYGTPVIVIDMGTATTVTVVDKNHCYRGGAIIPGLKFSYDALSAGTSLLPDISIAPSKRVIATNTVDSMRSGAVYGTAVMLDGMIELMENELGEKCTVVATGGTAHSVIPFCKREIIFDENLLLKGLWYLYDKNS